MNEYKKTKLLYVVEAMGGGVFTYIVDLANQLVKEYDMYIAYAIRPQTPVDYKDYFDKCIHLIEVKSFTRDINLLRELKAIREVKEIADKIQPDIIHLHSSKAGVIGRVAFSGYDIPLFYTPHGYSFLMQNYRPLKRYIFRFIETVMAKRNCTTISCSLGEHQETLKMTKNATYVSNGINTDDLDKFVDSLEITNHQFTVFTSGRICYQKNPKLFNEIALAMPNVRFLWIGDGELRKELSAPNIEVTGWVNRDKVIKESVNGDVFLLTSLWEGLPMSLLESMYMGKLCVVNDVIGNRDVIDNGRNGYVCRTVDEFVKGINGNMSLGAVAREDVIKEYNTQVMADKYSRIYRDKL